MKTEQADQDIHAFTMKNSLGVKTAWCPASPGQSPDNGTGDNREKPGPVPAGNAAARKPGPILLDNAASKQPVVLFIDDETTQRIVVREALAGEGFAVLEAENGLSGLEVFDRLQPDIVLLDIRMPGMDGFYTCRELRKRPAGERTPIVMLTVLNDAASIDRAYDAGATDFITKPVAWSVLARRLRYILRANAAFKELAENEAALKESEARFRSLAAMSSDWYWETDAEHRFIRGTWDAANVVPIWRPPLGKRRWELPSLSPDEATWEAHRALLDAYLPFRDFQLSRLGPDGMEYYLSVSGDPLFDSSGAFIGYRGIGKDITERKRAEKALRAAEEQFRGLVEQSIAGAYIIQDGTLAYVNPRCAEIFGFSRSKEIIGRDVLSIVSEKDRITVAERIRQIEGGVRSVNYEFIGLRKDGSTIDVGVHGSRATHQGRPAVIGLIQDISEKKRAAEEIERYVAQLKTAFMSTVAVATALSEMRDPYTAGHARRVAGIAVAIGAELGFDARRQEGLRVAGYMHDIGKMTIPAEILSKPGKLTDIELALMKGHPRASYDVLKDVDFPWPVARVALEHHERMDGSGYPQGLKGEEILFESRIMAVADVIEAMASHRPYRPGLGIDKALAEIERGRGSAYDPEVADACLRLFRDKGYQIPQ